MELILQDILTCKPLKEIHSNHTKVLDCHNQEWSITFLPNVQKTRSKLVDLDIAKPMIEAADTFLDGVTFLK